MKDTVTGVYSGFQEETQCVLEINWCWIFQEKK